ncbi:uncharacterized protein isoform X2 [Rhodnius prolixus]
MLGNGRDGREDIVVNNHHECIGRNTTSPVVPTAGSRPQLARRLSDLSVKVGTRTRFLVEVISATPVNVKWEKDGVAVEEDDHVRLVTEGQFHCIDISPVTLEDSGVWRVRVTNSFGATTSAAQLSLIVPKAYKEPEFVEPLRAVLTAQGTVSLECKVVGVPTPGLRWFKGDSEIKAGDVLALSHTQTDPSSLGTYTCLATNCMGSAKSTSIVHIDGAPTEGQSFLPSGPKPAFIRELRNERVKIGATITLECKVNVPPWPEQVSWYSPKGEAVESERLHIMEDGAGIYSLRINSVSAEDNGQWKCVASSKQGVKSMTTCTISVNFPKNYRKPKFLESLKAILTEEGLVSFECKVVGYPTPHLSWFKDGQELKPGDVYQLTGTNSLGSYCCIARNCMGEAESSAELTLEDIKSQLSEEERLQLTSEQLPPRFIQGLKSIEAKISENHKFTVQVSVFPEPTVLWFRDEEIIENNDRIKLEKEKLGFYHLTINKLEFPDQAEWKCVATNDFGQSITSCFLKLNIPRHYKKPKFLEDLKAVLSEEGAVNLECKVIGVPQPKLKWYKDGKELKPGDIHRIISGQDGTCCLGTYTCLAQNCMGTVSSSASLLGFEDKGQKVPDGTADVAGRGQVLTHDRSLSTIHEERTSQLHDTDKSTTIDDRAEEISFSFDGKEVSVSLYETPDLTEEEALQIVEMYADQISEHVSEHNVVELPPMRFTKESSTSGKLMMEAVVIDVSPEYFTTAPMSPRVIEDDLRTDMDVDDEFSMLEEAAISNLSPDEAAPVEILDELMESAPPIKPPRAKHKSVQDEAIEENNEPPVKRRAKKKSSDSEKEDDSLQEFERRKNLSKIQSEQQFQRRRTESELEDDSLYEFENRKTKEEFKSCHEDLGKCSPETGVAQTSENESMYSAVKTLAGASIDSKKSLTEDEGTFDTAEDSAFDKSEMSALESLAQSLHEIQKNLAVVASDSSAEMHSAHDLLESIAQPLSDVQKSIELVEAKMTDIPAGHCTSEVLQTLVEPITELQKNFALLERSSLPTILASVTGPLQELNREMTLIQQAAQARTEEHYNKSVEEVQETLTKIIERQQSVPSDTKIHDKLSHELHALEEKANDELETYYDKLLSLATDFRRRANVEDDKEIVDILKSVGDFVKPLKHLAAITSKCIAVIVEDNQLGIVPSAKVVEFLLKPLETLKTSLILLENVNMLRSHKAIRGAGIPVLYKISVPMDELETTIKLVENLSAHTAVEFLVPPLENLMKIVSELDITSGGEGFLENLPKQGAPVVRKLDNSLAVILRCIETIEKGVAVGDTERGLISKLPAITKPIEDLQKNLRTIEKNLNAEALTYEDVYNIAQELSKPLQSIRSEFSILQHEIEADQFGNEENPEQIALKSLIQPLESVQNCISSFHETVMCKSPEDPMHIRFVLFALKELNEPFGTLCSNIIKTEGAILGQGDPFRGLKILSRCVRDLRDVSSTLKTDFTLVESISTMLQKPLTQVLTSLENILQTVDKKGKETVNTDLLKQMEEPFKALQTVLLEIESGLDEPAAKEGANSEFRQAIRELRRSILIMQDQSSFEYGDEPSTIESNIETLQSLIQPLQVLKGRFTEIQRTSNKALIKADRALTSLRDSSRRVAATISEYKIQKLGSQEVLNILESLGHTIDKLENAVDDTNTWLGKEGKINDVRLKMEKILKTASEQLGNMCSQADDLAVSLEPGKRKSLVLIQDVIHDLKAAIEQSMQLLIEGGKSMITERNKSTLIAIEQLSAAMTSFHGQLNELDEFTLAGSLPRGLEALKQYVDTLAKNLNNIVATHTFDKNDQIILELVTNDVKSVQRVVDNLAQEGATDSARVKFVLAKVESLEEDLKDIARGMDSGDVMKKACQIALTVINIGEELLANKNENKMETLPVQEEPEVCVIGEILESVDCLESSFGKLKKSGRLAETVSETALADVSLEITMLLGMAEDLATGATGELLDKAHMICSPIKDIEEKIIHALEITNPEIEEIAEKLQQINKSLITAIKLSEKTEQEKEFEKLFSYDTLISSVDIPIIKSIVSSIGFMQTQLPTFAVNMNPKKEKLIKFLDSFENSLVKFGECVTTRQDEDELMDYLSNMRIELSKVQEGNMKPIQQLSQVVESLKDCVHPGGLSQILPELQAVLTPLRQLHEQLSRANKLQNITEQEVKYIEQFNEASNDLEISLVQLEKAAVSSGKLETESMSQVIERLVNYVREIEVEIPVQETEKDESILRPILQPILKMQHTVHELKVACDSHEKAKTVDILQSIAKPIRDLRTNVAIIYDQIMISHSPSQLDELKEAVAMVTNQASMGSHLLKYPLVQLQARLDELDAASELDEVVSEITGPVEELKKAMEILESEGEKSPLMQLCHQIIDFISKTADDTLSEMSSIDHASKAMTFETDPLLNAAILRHSLQEEQSISDLSVSSDTFTKAQEIEHFTEARAVTVDQLTAFNELKYFDISSVSNDVASIKDISNSGTYKATECVPVIQYRPDEKEGVIQSIVETSGIENKLSEDNAPKDVKEVRARSSKRGEKSAEKEQAEIREKLTMTEEMLLGENTLGKDESESPDNLKESKTKVLVPTKQNVEGINTILDEKQLNLPEALTEAPETIIKKETKIAESLRISEPKDNSQIKKSETSNEDLSKTGRELVGEAKSSELKSEETEKKVIKKKDLTKIGLSEDKVTGKDASKELTKQERSQDQKAEIFFADEKSNILGTNEKSDSKTDSNLDIKVPSLSRTEAQIIDNLEQFNTAIGELEKGLLQLEKAITTSSKMEIGFLAEVDRIVQFIDPKIQKATDESKSLQPLFQSIIEIQGSIAEIKEASEKGQREKAANVVQNMAKSLGEYKLNFANICHEGVLNQSTSDLEELKEAVTLIASQTPEKCQTLKRPLLQLQAKLENLEEAPEFEEVVSEISETVTALREAVETLETEGEQSILLKLCHQVVDIITKSTDNTLSEMSSVSQSTKALVKESELLLNAASLSHNLQEDQTFSDISEASESVTYAKEVVYNRPTAVVITEEQIALNEASKLNTSTLTAEVAQIKDASLGLNLAASSEITVVSPDNEGIPIRKDRDKVPELAIVEKTDTKQSETSPSDNVAMQKESLLKEETVQAKERAAKTSREENAAEGQKAATTLVKDANKATTVKKEESELIEERGINSEEQILKKQKQISTESVQAKSKDSILTEESKHEHEKSDKPTIQGKSISKTNEATPPDVEDKKKEDVHKKGTIREEPKKVESDKKTIDNQTENGSKLKEFKISVEGEIRNKQKVTSPADDVTRKDSLVKEELKKQEDIKDKPSGEIKTAKSQKEISPAKDAGKKDSLVAEELKGQEVIQIKPSDEEKTAKKQKEISPIKDAPKEESLTKVQKDREITPIIEEKTAKRQIETSPGKDTKKKEESNIEEDKKMNARSEEKTTQNQKETPSLIDAKKKEIICKEEFQEQESNEVKPSVQKQTAKGRKGTSPENDTAKKKVSLHKQKSKEEGEKESRPLTDEKNAKKPKETSPAKDDKKTDSLIKEESKEKDEKKLKSKFEVKTDKRLKETSPDKDVQKKDSIVKESTGILGIEPKLREEGKTAKEQKETSPAKDANKKDSLGTEEDKKKLKSKFEKKTDEILKKTSPDKDVVKESTGQASKEIKPSEEEKTANKEKKTSVAKDVKMNDSLVEDSKGQKDKELKTSDVEQITKIQKKTSEQSGKEIKPSDEAKTAESKQETSPDKGDKIKDSHAKESKEQDRDIKQSDEGKTTKSEKETSAAKDGKKNDSLVEDAKEQKSKELKTNDEEKVAKMQKEKSQQEGKEIRLSDKDKSVVEQKKTPSEKDGKKKDSHAKEPQEQAGKDVKTTDKDKTAKGENENFATKDVKKNDSLVEDSKGQKGKEVKPTDEEKIFKIQKETSPAKDAKKDSQVKEIVPSNGDKFDVGQKKTLSDKDIKKKEPLIKESTGQASKEIKPIDDAKTTKGEKETSPGNDDKKKDFHAKESQKQEDKEIKPKDGEKTAMGQKETSPAKDAKKKDSHAKGSKEQEGKDIKPNLEKTGKAEKETSDAKDVKNNDSLVEDSKELKSKEPKPTNEEKISKKQKETSPAKDAKKKDSHAKGSKEQEGKDIKPIVEKTAKEEKETSDAKVVKNNDSLVEDSKELKSKEPKPTNEEKISKKQKETSLAKDAKKKDSLSNESKGHTEKEIKPSVEENISSTQEKTSPAKVVQKNDSLSKDELKSEGDKEVYPSVAQKSANSQKVTSHDAKKIDSQIKPELCQEKDELIKSSVKDTKKEEQIIKEVTKREEGKSPAVDEKTVMIQKEISPSVKGQAPDKETSERSVDKAVKRSVKEITALRREETSPVHLIEPKLDDVFETTKISDKKEAAAFKSKTIHDKNLSDQVERVQDDIKHENLETNGDIKRKFEKDVGKNIGKDAGVDGKTKLLNLSKLEFSERMKSVRDEKDVRVETESERNKEEKADTEIKTEYKATVSTKTTTAEERMRAITVVELPDYFHTDYTNRVSSSADLRRYQHIPNSSSQDLTMHTWDRSKEISWRHLEFPIDDYERPQAYHRPRRSISPGPELHSLTHLPGSLHSLQNIYKSRRSASPLQLSKNAYSSCSLSNLVSSSKRHFDELHSVRYRPPTPTRLFSSMTRTKSGRIEHCERRAYICNGLVDKTVTHGGKIRLTCNIGGDPEPRIEWLKDGSSISLHTDPDRYTTVLDYGVASLEIIEAMSSDAGQYTCVVKNPNGQISATTATVRIAMPQSDTEDENEEKTWENVDDDLETDSLPKEICLSVKGPDIGMPRVTGLIADPVVPSGGTIALHVQVSGCTQPNVTWLREGTPIPRVAPRVHYLEDKGLFTLLLEGATPAESGVYTCRVSGGSGRWKGLVDTTTTVQVVERRAHEKPALFKVKPQSRMILDSGEDMTLTCYISGEPRPRVSLMKGIKDITNSCRTLKESFGEYFRLTLKRITRDDCGTFFIQARNVYGTDRAFVTLQVQDRSRSMSPPIRWFDRRDPHPSFREIHYNAYRSASTLAGSHSSLFYG